MMSIDSPLFRGSQWMHCKNATSTAIPPYGIAQVVGMDTAVVGDISQPVMLVRAAQADNPEVTVFTGPIGVPASGIGLCHSGDFGYARTSQGSFSIGTNQGVTSGSTSLSRRSGDFFEIGDTFTISGTTIGLFHKKSAGGGEGVLHFVSPPTGIPARSGLQMGSASCDIYDSSGTGLLSDSGANDTIYNMSSNSFSGSRHGVAEKNQAGLWVAIVEDCEAEDFESPPEPEEPPPPPPP